MSRSVNRWRPAGLRDDGEPGGHGGGCRLEEAFADAFYLGVEGNKAAFGPGHGPFFLHRFVLVDVGAEIDPDQGEDGQDAKGKEDDEDDGPQSHGMPWLWEIVLLTLFFW